MSKICGWGWRVFYDRIVRVQRYPMGMCMWRDKNIVKTVINVSDISWKRETNGVNNKKAKNGIKIMPLFPRYVKIQM